MPDAPGSGGQRTLIALIIAVVAFGFQQTAITPALPAVQQDLDASRQWTAWLFSGYLIVASVAPVFLGKLADRVGKRPVFLVSLGVFCLGSIGAALAPNIQLVVLSRVVQGVGGAVFPLSFSIARDELPPARLPMAIGLLTTGFGGGSVVGYVVGGAITQLLSWRWIFWVGTVALAAAVVLIRATVPRTEPAVRGRLDLPGGVLFSVALAALILAITEGPGQGWSSPVVLGLFGATVVAALGWFVRELHTEEPLLDLRVLRARPVLLTNVATMLSGYGLFVVNIQLPFLLEGSGSRDPITGFGLAAGPLLTGLVLLPRALGQVVISPLADRMSRRVGDHWVFAGGLALMAVGSAGLALERGSLWIILPELAILGAGFGLSISIAGTIVTSSVDRADTGIATGINSVLRRVGGGVGAQVAAAFMASFTLADGTPSESAFTSSFALGAGVVTLGALCAALVRTRGPRPGTAARQ